MFELGLGIVLAFWFVAVYFIYRRVFAHGYDDLAKPVLPSPQTAQLDGKPNDRRFLNSAEMSAHHAGTPREEDPNRFNQ